MCFEGIALGLCHFGTMASFSFKAHRLQWSHLLLRNVNLSRPQDDCSLPYEGISHIPNGHSKGHSSEPGIGHGLC